MFPNLCSMQPSQRGFVKYVESAIRGAFVIQSYMCAVFINKHVCRCSKKTLQNGRNPDIKRSILAFQAGVTRRLTPVPARSVIRCIGENVRSEVLSVATPRQVSRTVPLERGALFFSTAELGESLFSGIHGLPVTLHHL